MRNGVRVLVDSPAASLAVPETTYLVPGSSRSSAVHTVRSSLKDPGSASSCWWTLKTTPSSVPSVAVTVMTVSTATSEAPDVIFAARPTFDAGGGCGLSTGALSRWTPAGSPDRGSDEERAAVQPAARTKLIAAAVNPAGAMSERNRRCGTRNSSSLRDDSV